MEKRPLRKDFQKEFPNVGFDRTAHHTAINVRNVPERLDDDLKSHMQVCRVNIL